MGNEAGWFLRRRLEEGRRKLVVRGLYGVLAGGMAIGLGMLPLFYAVSVLIGEMWAGVVWAGVLVIAFAICRKIEVEVKSNDWSLDDVKKGYEGERRIGYLIDDAIAAEYCAVAHSVLEFGETGDIDHIVATPAAIWVIETKYGEIDSKRFSGVLNGLGEKVAEVRRWAPGRPTVRGCLVLAYGGDRFKKQLYDGNRKDDGVEEIVLYKRNTLDKLEQRLREDARSDLLVDKGVVVKVASLRSVGGR